MSSLRVGGIVLCGGRSKRMGRAKAWLPFGDELMLPRVLRLLRKVVDPVVVVAAPSQEVPPLPEEVSTIRDEIEGRGPLGGLSAGLHALKDTVDAAYLSSCDVPFLQPAFVHRMCDLLGGHSICVPKVGDFHHPLAAVYRADVIDAIDELLSEDRLRPVYLFEKAATRIVTPEELRDVDAEFRSLQNLNTPEDYDTALADAGFN